MVHTCDLNHSMCNDSGWAGEFTITSPQYKRKRILETLCIRLQMATAVPGKHCISPQMAGCSNSEWHFYVVAGRAGNKGTAITFISEEEDKYAPDLVKALTESGVPIPADLQALAASFGAKRKAGTAQAHGSGFGGTGFKFDTNEEETRRQARRVSLASCSGSGLAQCQSAAECGRRG